MAKDYLQLALGKFNVGIHQWYGWKDLNVPMSYSNIKLNDDTATMPTEAEVDAAIAMAKAGDTALLERVFESTAEASLNKITNAINLLKIQFTAGLAPALKEVSGLGVNPVIILF